REDGRLVPSIQLGDRGDGELLRSKSCPPSPREVEGAVRIIEADHQGEGAVSTLFQIAQGAIGEVSRVHRLDGEARRPAGGIEPHRGGVLEWSPRSPAVAASGGMSPEMFLPIRQV